MKALTRERASAKRDAGMALATDNADRDQPGWSGDAVAAVAHFCRAHGHGWKFLTEDVRLYASTLEIIERPANEKAWGSVMREALKAGFIRKIGYKPALSSNLSPKCLWEVV